MGFEEVLVVSLRSLIGWVRLRTRRGSLPRWGRPAIWVAVLAVVSSLGIRATAQSADSRLPRSVSLRHQSEDGEVIVVGLLGGFVPSNESHHPEVQLVRELQQEYPAGAYFRVFENHKINDANRAILQQLAPGGTASSTRENTQHVRVVLFGHSWGASAVVRLARKLEREGVPVALTIQVDSVAKPFSDDGLIPANVAEAVNFYQTRGLIHGRTEIRAADPTRTRIIGNFRREYKTEPSACHHFSWYSRLFTKGHIEIECDPDVWSEVRALLNAYLPHETIAQNPTKQVQDPAVTRIGEFAEPERIEGFKFNNR